MKHCWMCNQDLDISLFGKNKNTRDGLMPVCKSCNLARVKKWQKANPDKVKHSYEKQIVRHGLTLELHSKMLARHRGLCYSCQEEPATVIDHDHACCPGKMSCGSCVRGLLCSNCNTALGLLKDSEQRIIKLLNYATRRIND